MYSGNCEIDGVNSGEVEVKKKESKKTRTINATGIDFKKEYSLSEALIVLKKICFAKFIESVDVAIQLGINPKKTDQNIKGKVDYPHGLGKKIVVVVFTQGVNVDLAIESGADFVGMEDLATKIKNKNIRPDIVIASPDSMTLVRKLGAFLGPRGLMPNPKIGTVTDNLKIAVEHAKKGQIFYKNDKSGIVHATIGNVSFTEKQLQENFFSLIKALKRSKPVRSKGEYIKKVVLSTTMSSSVMINMSSLVSN